MNPQLHSRSMQIKTWDCQSRDAGKNLGLNESTIAQSHDAGENLGLCMRHRVARGSIIADIWDCQPRDAGKNLGLTESTMLSHSMQVKTWD